MRVVMSFLGVVIGGVLFSVAYFAKIPELVFVAMLLVAGSFVFGMVGGHGDESPAA